MRKVWNTIVVLGVLLCMVLSLGVTADAAEEDTAIFAVSGQQLAPESIDAMRTETPGCLVVDVDGLADGQSAAGYSAVYASAEPTDYVEYKAILPGKAEEFTVGAKEKKVVLAGVAETTTAEELAAAVAVYAADDPFVAVMGPAAAAAVVAGCPDVDVFLTTELDDAAAASIGVTAVSVGKQAEAPVSLVKVNDDNTCAAEAIAVPQAATVPAEDVPADGADEQTPADDTVEDTPAEDTPAEGEQTAEPPVDQTPAVCDVIYDGNGRDEGTFVPDDKGIATGDYVLRDNGYTKAGYTFVGWTLNVPDDAMVYQPGEHIDLTGDTTVYAKWEAEQQQEIPAEPAPADETASTSYTVTYMPGEGGGYDVAFAFSEAEKEITLPDSTVNSFTAPEGKQFAGWLEEGTGTVRGAGESYTVTADVNFVAQWAAAEPSTADENAAQTWKVTYAADNGTGLTTERTVDATGVTEKDYTLEQQPAEFTAPEGKTFGGWKIGETAYQPGAVVKLTGDATVTAVWNDVTKQTVNPAVDTFDLTFTKNSTEKLLVSYKAEIDTVSVDGTAITLNSDYGIIEDGDTETIAFENVYLNGLSVGSHTVNVTFKSTDTTDFSPDSRTLTITPDPNSQVDSIKQDWDRSQNLIIDFAQYDRGNPTKLELLQAYEKDAAGNYKQDGNGNYIPVWKTLTEGKDFTVNGSAMTIYPSLLGTWKNQQYGFRVTFDGAGTTKGATTMLLYLNVTGTVPAAQATATPAPSGSAGYVTGDNVNLRAGAGTDSKVLRTVTKGTKLTIYSITNGWANVSVDGVNGYMSANYVAYETAATATPNPNGTSPATGDTNNVTLYIVILVVLIVALAAVLIIVIKRRKN